MSVLAGLGEGLVLLAQAQTPTVALMPVTQRVQIDSLGTLSVRLKDVHGVHAYAVELAYDTAVVRMTRVTRRPFFAVTTLFLSSIDSVRGVVTINEAILGPGGQDGTGDAAEMRFRARVPGSATVSVTLADLRDTLNNPISVTATGAEVVIGPLSAVDIREGEAKAAHAMVCYPNPCNPSTTVRYWQGTPGETCITIHTVLGHEVRAEFRNNADAGMNEWIWNGRDAGGRTVASGVYIVRVQTASSEKFARIVMVR